MSTKDENGMARPTDPVKHPAKAIKTRKITVDEAKASARKAMDRYGKALKELARR